MVHTGRGTDRFKMLPAKDLFTKIGNLNFHYLLWGGGEASLVLLHGLASNAHFWDLTAPYLSGRFKIVALDQRGHGDTDKPDKGYDVPTVAQDVECLIRTLDLKSPVIVGHSWGGNVAVQVAVDYPGLVSGLVCIDGGFIEPSAVPGAEWEQTKRRMAPPDFVELDFTWEQLVERAKTWGTATFWGDKLEDFLQSNFTVLATGKIRPKLTRARHFKILKGLWDQRVSELYQRISCPVLLMPTSLTQHQDAAEKASAERRQVNIEKATGRLSRHRLVWMEDSIHDVPIQRPAEVANVIIQAVEDGFFDNLP